MINLKKYIQNGTCYYSDDVIKFNEYNVDKFNVDNILIFEKLPRNILVYNISYKTLIDSNPLRIRFDKIDGFIRVYDGTRYLVLFGGEEYEFIYNRM